MFQPAATPQPSEPPSPPAPPRTSAAAESTATRRAIIVFPAPGRTDQQHVVPAGGGNLERAAGQRLPEDVGEVRSGGSPSAVFGGRLRVRQRWNEGSGSFSAATASVSVRDRKQPQARDDRSLGGVAHGQQQPAQRSRRAAAATGSTPRAGWMPPSSESSPSSTVSAMSRRLTRPVAARMPSAIGRSNADPALRTSAGREVDGDAVRRELEAGVADRAAHAVAALAHAGVRQSDHPERRQAERHVYFDLDRTGLDTEHRGGAHACEHALTRCKAVRTAESRDLVVNREEHSRNLPPREGRIWQELRSPPATARAGSAGAGDEPTGSSACASQNLQPIAGRDVIAVQAGSASDLGDGRVEQARDRRQRVAALDLYDSQRGGRAHVGTVRPSPTPLIARDGTVQARRAAALAASRPVGARGITSSCPARTGERIDSLLASARSARLTLSLRAMVAIDSPRRTV